MSNTKKIKFYNLDHIKELNCQYNLIIGERSNGKTYAALKEVAENWWRRGEQGGYIRRWKEDYRGKRGSQLFAGHVENGFISELTEGEYDRVRY